MNALSERLRRFVNRNQMSYFAVQRVVNISAGDYYALLRGAAVERGTARVICMWLDEAEAEERIQANNNPIQITVGETRTWR